MTKENDPRNIFNKLAQAGHFACVKIENDMPIFQITESGRALLALAFDKNQQEKA